jgi:hypothetical protein
MAQEPTDSADDDRTATLLAALLQQNAELLAEIKRLLARVAELEAKLGQPPKTPDNSSLPPSRGHKANAEPPATKPQRKGRPGVTRMLTENPDATRRVYAERRACGAVLGEAGQNALFSSSTRRASSASAAARICGPLMASRTQRATTEITPSESNPRPIQETAPPL